VIVVINGDKLELRMPSAQLIRSMAIDDIDKMELATDGQHLIIRNKKDYDMVIEFDATDKLLAFRLILENK